MSMLSANGLLKCTDELLFVEMDRPCSKIKQSSLAAEREMQFEKHLL